MFHNNLRTPARKFIVLTYYQTKKIPNEKYFQILLLFKASVATAKADREEWEGKEYKL